MLIDSWLLAELASPIFTPFPLASLRFSHHACTREQVKCTHKSMWRAIHSAPRVIVAAQQRPYGVFVWTEQKTKKKGSTMHTCSNTHMLYITSLLSSAFISFQSSSWCKSPGACRHENTKYLPSLTGAPSAHGKFCCNDCRAPVPAASRSRYHRCWNGHGFGS